MAELKIKADSGGGTVALKGPATTTSNAAVQLTLPVDDGAADTFLKSNGSGVLSWASAADATKLPLAGGTMTGTLTAKSIGIQSGSYVYGSSGMKLYGDGSDNDTKLVQIVDGNVKLASGKGVDFSATSDAGTVDSEVLSDYENGEWTPTAKSSVTLSTAKGYYTRIGHRVICDMFVQVDSDNSNTSFTITNLPYAGGNGWDLSVPAIRIASWDLPSDTLWVSGHTGASEMAFHCNKDNANYVALPADSGGSMIVSFAYEVA